MKVLAKDLCKPEVVAAIAKIGFFEIEDRRNVTTEMWEKFRDMTRNVHHTQPVDPEDLEAKLRNCPPRLSEPPTPPPDCSRSLSQTPIEDPVEMLERFKLEAKQAYDTLIQMGGRPTRPIRSTPPWTKVPVGGEIWYRYAEQYEELFYDSWYGYKPGPNNSLTEADFIRGHWRQERGRCNEELRRWQDFLDTQQRRREHHPEFAREEDMERQRYPQDPELTASLKKLKDWKEYQGYFQRWIDRLKRGMEGARRAVEAVQRKDPEVYVNKRGRDDKREWLRTIERQREKLPAEEKRLEWVKKQLPAVLSECAASLMELPTSRRQMEEKSELGAKQVYNTLMDTGGRPSRPIRPVPDVYDAEHTDEDLHALCHWEESPTQVDLWKDYRAYLHLEVDNAKQWVEFWRRQVVEFQDTENHCALQGWSDTAERYHSEAEDARSYAEEARKQVGPPEMRLKWAEQQLSACLAECAVSTTEVSTSNPLEDQAMPPKRASKSGQTTLKDLRSNRSDKSALRNNHDNKKNRPSANSALGPIHSSKVSKAAGRKTPGPRRPSKIPAERDDGQNQGLNITISPSPPANVAPRRSRRLSTNQKRSGALEADLAADLGRNAQPQPTEVMLRRSDRISKQKERMSTSTSSAALSSVVILQTAPFPRSKSKGRVAGTKPDRSWGKPRGISKTQGRDLSRKRAEIHT
ncbi:hypothetical protein HO173_003168 [Letharia columbiana]|uniref:Uncharacterized protein n=1 Tax=Letharia columbiana TaxID=112416 RepID=A0A8H6L7J5_9LECA|nr:uncharacterized protein HO173_003168 [Letharia columbiana]KAF6238662.1 hypothetical protein HO173_003168 [Letharia columbiana]